MNPFTRSLLEGVQDREVIEFVEHWDRLEILVIAVFRAKNVSLQVQNEHRQVRSWLVNRYPLWQPRLAPYWLRTRTGREPTTQDPFAALLDVKQAEDFVKNWGAMQLLPAAREALNQFLLETYGG